MFKQMILATAAAEKLRVAMIDPTPAALTALVADDLRYGHSGGRVDTKDSFIGDLIAGKSDFVTIVITDQTIKVVGNTAIVRHALTANTNGSGKPGKVHHQDPGRVATARRPVETAGPPGCARRGLM